MKCTVTTENVSWPKISYLAPPKHSLVITVFLGNKKNRHIRTNSLALIGSLMVTKSSLAVIKSSLMTT